MQTLTPTAVRLNNLSGSASDLDDSPDAPDGLWCTRLGWSAWAASPSVGTLRLVGQTPGINDGDALVHGDSFVVSGSGFGTKNRSLIWDDGSSGTMSLWSGAWPSASGNDAYNTGWRTTMREVALPHSNITRYLCGAHYPNDSYLAGWNVVFWKMRTGITYPIRLFASWYQRADPNWVFGLNDPSDENYKCFQIDNGGDPYAGDVSNFEYNGRPTSLTATPGWHIYHGGDPPARFVPDNIYGESATNPMSGAGHRVSGRVWVKIEWEIYFSTSTDGYAKVWEDGVLKIDQSGQTARAGDTQLCQSIGGYARGSGNTNNWRYFADVYLDESSNGGRFLLANDATLSNATIREVQPWTSWSDSSVTVTCNKGALASGTAHLHYVASGGASTYIGVRALA